MNFSTRVVRPFSKNNQSINSIIPPIYQSTTFIIDEIGINNPFDYTRSSNPTRELLEKSLAKLESGNFAISFSSGMSAIDSCMKLLKARDHVVCSSDLYGGVTRLFKNISIREQIEFSFVDTTDLKLLTNSITKSTKMIWLETPSNPMLTISDINKISNISKQNNILLVVDSTIGTPVFIRPLTLGADIVIQSTTKFINGHNQIIGGAIITNNEYLYNEFKFFQKTIGAVPSPFDCWLTIIGMKTLYLRMKQQSRSALIIANYLQTNKKIKKVIYPGLKTHPQHLIARKQMNGYGSIITFEMNNDINSCVKFLNKLSLCDLAESFGAVETMITHPATMTHSSLDCNSKKKQGITDTLIRLSVGIEHANDIIDDLEQALS
jgi:cystathionine beta-lyase/cystathionine gamma-synthase